MGREGGRARRAPGQNGEWQISLGSSGPFSFTNNGGREGWMDLMFTLIRFLCHHPTGELRMYVYA